MFVHFATMVAEPTATYGSVIELDAFELHRRMIGFQRVADHARAEFLKHLAIFDDGQRYLELGYSCSAHYLIREFGFGRTDALEHLRVVRRLVEFPLLAEALSQGELR